MSKKERYQEFFEEMEQWVKQQIKVFTNATALSYEEYKKNPEKTEARDAAITYQSRLEAYEFLAGKFLLFHEGKQFNDLPDNLLKEIKY
jgi:hypothetical protein